MRIRILSACSAVAGCLAVLLFASCRIDAPERLTAPDTGRAALGWPDGLAPRSDDDAPVRVTNIRVQRVSGVRNYEAVEGGMADEATVYIDRLYTYENVPALVQGQTYIQTASGDQTSSGDEEFLTFEIDRAAIVYVAYHGTAVPGWLGDAFTYTGETVTVRKNGPTMTFHLFARSYPAGEVVLGSNREGGGSAAMYTVVVRAAPSGRGPPVRVTDVEAASGRVYEAVEGGLAPGARIYMDRDFHYEELLPQLVGQTYVRTRSNDQAFQPTPEFLRFTIDRAATVVVAYHAAGEPPAWLRGGFTETGEEVIVRRNQQRLRFLLHARGYAAGEVVLGSNRDGPGVAAMYGVIVLPAGEAAGPLRSIRAGFQHSCGVAPDGAGYCWGDNTDRGQLGDGTWTSRRTPVAVLGGHRFAAISAGAHHSCGLTQDGRAYCWGKNNFGQLGIGNKQNRNEPVAVAGGLSFTAIGAGGYSSCGLAADGRVYCWGRNNRGQLGNGAVLGFTTTTPVAVAGGHAFTSLSVGFEHVCAVRADERGYCWGKNTLGQLGDGTNNDRRSPVRVVDGHRFLTISTTGVGTGPGGDGQNHTCGLDTDGHAWCWGNNWHNNLGTGEGRGHRTRPQRVAGEAQNRSFERIVTGGDHSCAVTADGRAWCWGDNLRGQLGNGPRQDYNPPARVAGPHRFQDLAAGWDHTCGVTTAGEPYCWGWNNKGQLGDGTLITRDRPVRVQFR